MGRFLLGSTVVMLLSRGQLAFNPEWAPRAARSASARRWPARPDTHSLANRSVVDFALPCSSTVFGSSSRVDWKANGYEHQAGQFRIAKRLQRLFLDDFALLPVFQEEGAAPRTKTTITPRMIHSSVMLTLIGSLHGKRKGRPLAKSCGKIDLPRPVQPTARQPSQQAKSSAASANTMPRRPAQRALTWCWASSASTSRRERRRAGDANRAADGVVDAGLVVAHGGFLATGFTVERSGAGCRRTGADP